MCAARSACAVWVFLSGRPIEIRQSQLSRDRLRVDLDRFLEGRFGLILPLRRLLHCAKARITQGVLRIELDRFLDLLDCPVEILQAGERVGEQELRLDVLPIQRECVVGARLGVFELVRIEEELARLDLRLDVLRQEIGGPHVLRAARLASPF